MRNVKTRTCLALLIITLLFLAGCAGVKKPDGAETMTVTDSIGRQVTIPKKVNRVVVSNRYNIEIIQSVGGISKVVGVDYGIYQDQRAYGNFFTRDQVIGKGQMDLNYEKIIELNPEVLIITGNGAWEDASKKLEPFGIKVVVMDAYYTDKFRKTYTLAGKIFGAEERAEEFIRYFEDKLKYVTERLKDVPKKKVYYEYKRAGWTTVPGDYFYYMLEYAHADNIFRTAQNTEVDVEAVIEKNPEVIIKVGEKGVDPRYLPPSEEEFKRRLQAIIERPGWDQIKAVKDGRILLISQYAQGGAAKLVGTMYMAKYLYPEYLPDLHPEEVFKEWVTKYQQLPYVEGHTYPRFKLDD